MLIFNNTVETMTVIRWGVVIGASLVAAVWDLRKRRIPNAITFPLLVVGLIWAAWFGGLKALAESAGACVLLALPYVLLFVFAGGGAGDAKLMGAIGSWLGLKNGLAVLVCVIMAGMILAIAKSIAQKQFKNVLTSVFVSFYGLIMLLMAHKTVRPASIQTDVKLSDKLDIPYGVAIFAGVCAGGGVIWLS